MAITKAQRTAAMREMRKSISQGLVMMLNTGALTLDAEWQGETVSLPLVLSVDDASRFEELQEDDSAKQVLAALEETGRAEEAAIMRRWPIPVTVKLLAAWSEEVAEFQGVTLGE